MTPTATPRPTRAAKRSGGENPRFSATRPVRVCFVIDRLSRAGTESQLLALIRELDRRTVEPSLVLLDGTDAESRSLEPADCPVVRLGVKSLLSRGAVRAARTLAAVWRGRRPDVVQVYFLDAAYFGVPVARWCGVPKVVRVRNNLGYWLTRKHRVLNRLVGRLADVTVTNTDAGRDALVAAERLPPGRVAVLENGVDVERFVLPPLPLGERVGVRGIDSPGGETSTRRGSVSPQAVVPSPGLRPPSPPRGEGRTAVRVGCVANLRAVKNIDGLVRAAKLVRDRFPNAEFAVAGDGPDRAALESLRDSLGLGGHFVFRGSEPDVPAFLRTLDIAVLPSHSEGMSNAVLEYLAAGKAVVATDVGANAKLLGGGCGILVPPGDPAALADAIAGLVADPVAVARLGAAGRARVEAEYSRRAMVRRFERFYAGLAGSA